MLCCLLTFLIVPPLIIFNLSSTWGPGKQWRFSGNAVTGAAGLICRQQREEESDGDSESRLEQTPQRSFRRRRCIATVSSGGVAGWEGQQQIWMPEGLFGKATSIHRKEHAGAFGEPRDRPPTARETRNGNRFEDGAHFAPLLSIAA